MANVEKQFLQFWTSKEVRIALWADSSYGPLEESDILKLAKEVSFPIVHFTCSFGGGLTVKGDFHDPAGKPEEIVIIEMGYNDESNLSPANVINKMRKQQWYKVLSQSASVVKFVIFVHQPTYRQVCPPKKKNFFNAGWTRGSALEGSKYTEQAMQLCQQELGIPALCLKGDSVKEMFADMLIDQEGEAWQNEAVSRCAANCTKKGPDYDPQGRLALWEDSQHPTAQGAELHFRCLVNAFQARCVEGGFSGGARLATASVPHPNTNSVGQQAAWASKTTSSAQYASSAPQSAWAPAWQRPQQQAQAWQSQQAAYPAQGSWQSQQAWPQGAAWNVQQASWRGKGQGRSQPY